MDTATHPDTLALQRVTDIVAEWLNNNAMTDADTLVMLVEELSL